MKKIQKGFTLIELLVVIAIIGLLASIVLVSVGGARNTAKDAAVKSQLASMRSQAELYYSTHSNSYDTVCIDDQSDNGFGAVAGPGLLYATIQGNAIGTTSNVTDATAGAYNTTTCHDTATGWAVEAPLTGSASGAVKMWCVDSTGASKEVTGASTTIGASSDITC